MRLLNCFLRKNKKIEKKGLQFVKMSDIITKSLEESTNNRKVWKHRKKLLKVMKEISKKLFKNFEKVLTNENECDIIIHALLREAR